VLLLGGTLALIGLALLQTRHMAPGQFKWPDMALLWGSSELSVGQKSPATSRAPYSSAPASGASGASDASGSQATSRVDAAPLLADTPKPSNDAAAAALDKPDADIGAHTGAHTGSHTGAHAPLIMEDGPSSDTATHTPMADQSDAESDKLQADLVTDLTADLAADLAAERVAHARTVKALKKARRAATNPDNAEAKPLVRRALMAEWLVRLNNGLPFDDLLSSGPTDPAAQPTLETILTQRELSAFGLFAAKGVPTPAGLRAQIARLSDVQLRQAEAAPLGSTPPRPTGWLGWLADNSAGLVRVAAAPTAIFALENRDIAELDGFVGEADYARATIEVRRLLMQWEAQENIATQIGAQNDAQNDVKRELLALLHTLYDDTRALAELTPLRRALEADFIAGVRP
jgi:hypothetical protein